MTRKSPLAIKDLVKYGKERLGLSLIAGEHGLHKELSQLSIRIYDKEHTLLQGQFGPADILIIEREEISWLAAAVQNIAEEILDAIKAANISLIICSKTTSIPHFLTEFAEKESIPLVVSDLDVFPLESRLIGFLREKIHHVVTINGVFVEVLGMGVIIVGESGIGKSECGLELVARGHKLIADDIIEIKKRGDDVLSGQSLELTKYFMEIRGLGIINVKRMFGVAAVSDESPVQIMVEFVRWEKGAKFDRIESDEQYRTIMGVDIPVIRAPVRSGGSMATIVEIVARNEILKKDDYNASRDLKKRVFDQIRRGKGKHI